MKLPANVDPMMDIRADARFMALHELVDSLTMTPIERQKVLYDAVLYLHNAGISGDIMEVGVWRGGSMLLVASLLAQLGDTNRTLWLADTYLGMTEPSEVDVDYQGTPGERLYKSDFMKAGEEEVRANMKLSGYPEDKIRFVVGDVRKTAKEWVQDRLLNFSKRLPLALLRLDSDFYESTKAALGYLHPCVVTGGIVIEDDYNFWAGAKKAVDEYFDGKVFLHRIDSSAVLWVKR